MSAVFGLGPWREPTSEVLVQRECWLASEPIKGQFFVPARTLRLVYNYLRRYGLLVVVRKIFSRLAEKKRNAKVVGLGVGRVIEVPSSSPLQPGDRVVFAVPTGSESDVEFVVPSQLVMKMEEGAKLAPDFVASPLLEKIKGYSRYSGAPLPIQNIQEFVQLGSGISDATDSGTSKHNLLPPSRRTLDRIEATAPGIDHRPTAVMFGLGQYAKTQIIPNINRHMRLSCVHEIDPDQAKGFRTKGITLDTSPLPRPEERYDAWFCAGFHHTHASLASTALARGGVAIVEKPLATDWKQYRRVREAVETRIAAGRGSGVYVCFQKRYASFNKYVHADLGVTEGDAVHMAALVFETPLPPLHWYRWPSSGSPIISNACHWLDFFMFVNAYSPTRSLEARTVANSDIHCRVELENGACMFLQLTHLGSDRVGVRENVELRSDTATIRILDQGIYESENKSRIVRRRHVNSVDAYGRMYRAIAREIVAGRSLGDSIESFRSTELMLNLERDLRDRNEWAMPRDGQSFD